MMYSVMMFKPGVCIQQKKEAEELKWYLLVDWYNVNEVLKIRTWFVVAVIIPIGRVKKKASAQASKTPHQGNWSWSM
jgi:hypothetical protein